jgi:hypothetical protein
MRPVAAIQHQHFSKDGRLWCSEISCTPIKLVSRKTPKFTVYDNGLETFDRYTVFDNSKPPETGLRHENALLLSAGLEMSIILPVTRGEHLGEIVPIGSLPRKIQDHIKERIK